MLIYLYTYDFFMCNFTLLYISLLCKKITLGEVIILYFGTSPVSKEYQIINTLNNQPLFPWNLCLGIIWCNRNWYNSLLSVSIVIIPSLLACVMMNFLTGNETLGSLAVEAANGALEMAQVDSGEVDLIIMCSSTPDDLFGSGGQVCQLFYNGFPKFSSFRQRMDLDTFGLDCLNVYFSAFDLP